MGTSQGVAVFLKTSRPTTAAVASAPWPELSGSGVEMVNAVGGGVTVS